MSAIHSIIYFGTEKDNPWRVEATVIGLPYIFLPPKTYFLCFFSSLLEIERSTSPFFTSTCPLGTI